VDGADKENAAAAAAAGEQLVKRLPGATKAVTAVSSAGNILGAVPHVCDSMNV
jgi:hypothetical protein